MDRRELRRQMRQRRACLCSGDTRALSQAVLFHVLALEAYRSARRVLIYVAALENEVHTSDLIAEALARGVEVYTPVVLRRERRLAVHRLRALDELEPGAFGIPEVAPAHRTGEADPRGLDCAVVPGVAFDRAGTRLGMGGGYFDRLLAGLELVRIGLAYGFQLVPEIPREPWDVPVDWIVTELGALDCRRPAQPPAAPRPGGTQELP